MRREKNENNVILESSLQTFFFDHLQEVNRKSTYPLPNETIHYSSLVMDHFGLSGNFFEKNDDGTLSEKILGEKLLKVAHRPKESQIRELKDIGDTCLFLCGYFSDSVRKKIVDVSYYQQLGEIAYHKLNVFRPGVYEQEEFYKNLSASFHRLTCLMSIVSNKFLEASEQKEYENILFVSSAIKAKVS